MNGLRGVKRFFEIFSLNFSWFPIDFADSQGFSVRKNATKKYD